MGIKSSHGSIAVLLYAFGIAVKTLIRFVWFNDESYTERYNDLSIMVFEFLSSHGYVIFHLFLKKYVLLKLFYP